MITKTNFMRYENLRRSGKVNMFEIGRVQFYTWLGHEKILEIMKNYDKYAKKYLRKDGE